MALLDDDAVQALSSRRATFMLKSLAASWSDSTSLLVPVDARGSIATMKDIERVFQKLDVGITVGGSALTNEIAVFSRDQHRFSVFAATARDIWERNLLPKDLSDFSDYLSSTFPTRTLYRLQLLASYHLAFARNACNFSVPGAGKTAVVLAAYGYLRDRGPGPRTNKLLVVGPLSSFAAWESEYKECFGRPPAAVRLAGGMSSSERSTVLLSARPSTETPELLLFSYQSLSNSIHDVVAYLQRTDIEATLVLDEAHRVKNTDGGQWAQAALEVAPFALNRVVLTGTPAPNGYQDLFNLFRFIWPTKEIIPYHVGQLREMSDNPGDSRIEPLLDSIKPFFIRIRKSDLGIPAAIETDSIHVPMGPIQSRIYAYIETRTLRHLVGPDYGRSIHGLLSRGRLVRLMQAASYPALLAQPLDEYEDTLDDVVVDDPDILALIKNYDNLEESAKIAATVKRTGELVADGQKVIIWCNFVGTIRHLHRALKNVGIDNRMLYGGHTDDDDGFAALDRERTIELFHDPKSTFKVLIGNPLAVGESISLHKACQHAVYLERNFNAGLHLQSKDRIHRVGMPEGTTATYHYFNSLNTVDGAIERRLDEKMRRMMSIVEAEDIPLLDLASTNLGEEYSDILEILMDYERRQLS